MAIVRLASNSLTLVASAIISAIDANGLGKFKFYTGPMPATPQTAISTQTLLGTLRTANPCGTLSGTTITFNALTQDDAADADGQAIWVRVTDGADNVVMDLDVTVLAGTGAIRMNTIDIVKGGPIRINSAVLYIGA